MTIGFNTSAQSALIRGQLWTGETKTMLEDELMGQTFVRDLGDISGNSTINIPSIGQMVAQDFVEGQPAKYTAADVGNFTFTINKYKQSGTAITRAMMQDSFAAQEIMSMVPVKSTRAILEAFEADVFALQGQQTAADLNEIDSFKHRWVASGSNNTLTLNDFIEAGLALDTANVPSTGRVAIVPPAAVASMNKLAGTQGYSNNPAFEGIVRTGFATGMRFIANVFGFDVYVSNRLTNIASETIDSRAGTDVNACLFFSTESDSLPFVAAWAQRPIIDGEFNKDLQQEEYVNTARWGTGLYRQEGLVTVLASRTATA